MNQDGASTSSATQKRSGGDLRAIFVHAGAGYHSRKNEHVHLQACANACRMAMAFLNDGATAVDAVEVAIQTLENDEVTNAGYGSNLAMDGTVEGDATVVDHLGRSGAVGAITGVLNPIHVARLVLEESTKPLSLSRVPPNLLVSQGAQDYAFVHNIPILTNDYLVSPAAKERWLKWSQDLQAATQQKRSYFGFRKVAPLGNEGQHQTPPPASTPHPPLVSSLVNRQPTDIDSDVRANPLQSNREFAQQMMTTDFSKKWNQQLAIPEMKDSAFGGSITDTVGAIAVDIYGNISAGSSSGGIGMKYRGRVGPAALVGVGSAVIPMNSADRDGTCTASVCSGTGEHMATTMAANTSASRVHYCQTTRIDGSIHEAHEQEALTNFIKIEFLKHPSVAASNSTGAIGIMSAKKTNDGIHLYWAHNTESFALGSMTSKDPEPHVVMSRASPRFPGTSHSSNQCTSGGRSMRASGPGGPKYHLAKRQKRVDLAPGDTIPYTLKPQLPVPMDFASEGLMETDGAFL